MLFLEIETSFCREKTLDYSTNLASGSYFFSGPRPWAASVLHSVLAVMLPCFWRCEADNGGVFLFLVFCAWHSLLCSGCCCLSSVLLLSARAGEDLLKSSEDAAAGLSTELTITLYEMLGRQSEWWALFSLFSYYPGSELEMGSCSSQDQQQKPRFSSSYLSLRIYIYVCIYTFFFQFSLRQFYIYTFFSSVLPWRTASHSNPRWGFGIPWVLWCHEAKQDVIEQSGSDPTLLVPFLVCYIRVVIRKHYSSLSWT